MDRLVEEHIGIPVAEQQYTRINQQFSRHFIAQIGQHTTADIAAMLEAHRASLTDEAQDIAAAMTGLPASRKGQMMAVLLQGQEKYRQAELAERNKRREDAAKSLIREEI